MKTALLILLLATSVLASVVFIADPTTRRVTQIIYSAHTPAYEGNTNAFINPVIDLNVLFSTPLKILPNAHVTNINAAEIALDASNAAVAFSNGVVQARIDAQQAGSIVMLGSNSVERILRAFALLSLDQINLLRKTNGLPIITTNVFLNAMSNAVLQDPK